MWVYLPSACLAEPAVLTSPPALAESGPSLTASGTLTPKPSSCPESGTDDLRMPRFGTTSQPSTEAPGAERWISSLEDSPVSRTQSQDIGGGADDHRNLWPDTLRVLRECGAWGFVGENVSGIIANGFAAQVMADLEREGFCGAIFSNTACAAGAPHMRERVFFVGHSKSIRRNGVDKNKKILRPDLDIQDDAQRKSWLRVPFDIRPSMDVVNAEPRRGVQRVDDGLEQGAHRLRCAGNGVVPSEAIPAFEKLKAWAGIQ